MDGGAPLIEVTVIVWMHKDFNTPMISFDAPDEKDLENWVVLSTKERHYSDIAKILEKQALLYRKQEDFRSFQVAINLAKELKHHALKDTTIN